MYAVFNFFRSACIALLHRTAAMWPDKPYLKVLHFMHTGKKLDLDNPKTYSEKCQWMKLYYQRPELSAMVDKYEVKRLVAEKIGSEYVVECYGVWEHFDEIDFDRLPDQFVLKCTHNSGGFVICKDKKTFDIQSAKQKMEPYLKAEYYKSGREWAYKHVKPRILAERYMDSLGKPESIEYKITCMGGEVQFVTICTGIAHAAYSQRHNDHFSKEWVRQDWYARYKPTGRNYELTEDIKKMMELSEKLAEGLPQVRVDWYVHEGHIYFGEFTFYTWAGWPHFTPQEWDAKLGESFVLPQEKYIESRSEGVKA